MRSTITTIGALLTVTLFLASMTAFADIVGTEITANTATKLKAPGAQPVSKPIDHPESSWPESRLYAWINATPEEAAAIFTDYKYQTNYVPHLIKAAPKFVDSRTYNVSYELEDTINIKYTIRDSVSKYTAAGGPAYKVNWKLVTDDNVFTVIKDTVGSARFEAFDGGTIMAYFNFVTPLASTDSMKDKAVKQVKDTVLAFKAQMEKEHNDPNGVLARQLKDLHKALPEPGQPDEE